MTAQEVENFLRYALLVVDLTKETFVDLLQYYLEKSGITLVQFITKHQHDLYHMCYSEPCCLCPTDCRRSRAPKIIFPPQLAVLFDTNGGRIPGHNPRSVAKNCCCPVNTSVSADDFDVTLLRVLLLNFTAISPAEIDAVEELVKLRNHDYAHARKGAMSNLVYQEKKKEIKKWLLVLLTACGKENKLAQELQDHQSRVLDTNSLRQLQSEADGEQDMKQVLRQEINKAVQEALKNYLSNSAGRSEEVTSNSEGDQPGCTMINEVLNDQVLQEIAEHLSDSWHEAILHLNMSHKDINFIEHKFPRNLRKQGFEALCLWRNKRISENTHPDNLVEELLQAFREMERGDIINIIEGVRYGILKTGGANGTDMTDTKKSNRKRPLAIGNVKVLSDKNINTIAKHLLSDWKEAFIMMGMTNYKAIEIEHKHDRDIRRQAFDALVMIKKQYTDEEELVEKLIGVFKDMDRKDLVDVITDLIGKEPPKKPMVTRLHTKVCYGGQKSSPIKDHLTSPLSQTYMTQTQWFDSSQAPPRTDTSGSITAKVVHKSDIITFGKNVRKSRIELLLFDGEKYIKANAFGRHAAIIHSRYQKQKVYYISNFKIMEISIHYPGYQLEFYEWTKQYTVPDDLSFTKLSIAEIKNNCKSKQIVSLGPVIITAVGPCRKPNVRYFREVMLKDNSGKVIMAEWSQFDNIHFPFQQGKIVNISNVEVAKFNGNTLLEVSVIFNKDFSEVESLPFEIMGDLLDGEDPDELQPVKMNIKDIKTIGSKKHLIIIPQANIETFSKGKFEMLFMNCDVIESHGKLKRQEDEWYCSECGACRVWKAMVHLQAEIVDSTGSMWIQLFDKTSSIILGRNYDNFVKYDKSQKIKILKDIEKSNSNYTFEICGKTKVVKKVTVIED